MSRRIWTASLTFVAALGIAAGVWLTRPTRVYSDGAAISRPAAAESPRQVLWELPRPLDGLAGIAMEVYEPRMSWDGQTLYFVGGKSGGSADVYTATRTPKGWADPQPLADVNSAADDLGPQPAPDGSALYFYSDRPGGCGGYDLWVARRSSDDPTHWLDATNLGSSINSEWNDYGPAVSPDGGMLLFASNRPRLDDERRPDPQAWSATVRESFFNRPYDLYSASIGSAEMQGAQPVDRLNSPASEGAPCFSPGGDFVYFASNRAGGRGGFDLYRARRLHGAFLPPENLGAALNTAANELDPGIAAIGFELYFSSDRALPGNSSGVAPPRSQPADTQIIARPPPERHYHLFHTTTREVFVENADRPPIDWAGLASALWPNLLWLLLGLLALLLLLVLVRDMRDRRLSLLARCLLASLLLHCLLLTGFGFWRISTAVADFVRGRGPVQVVMADTGLSAQLMAQIRGTRSDAPAVAPLEIRTPLDGPALPAITPPQVRLAALDSPHEVKLDAEWRVEPRESKTTDAAPPDVRPVVTARTDATDLDLPRDASRLANTTEATMKTAPAVDASAPSRPDTPSPAPAAGSVVLAPLAEAAIPMIESHMPTPVDSNTAARSDSSRIAAPALPPALNPGNADLIVAVPTDPPGESATSQPAERDISSLAFAVKATDLPRAPLQSAAASQPAFAMKLDESERQGVGLPASNLKIEPRDAGDPSAAPPLRFTGANSPPPAMPNFAIPSDAASQTTAGGAAARAERPPRVDAVAAKDAATNTGPRAAAGLEFASRPMKPVELAPARGRRAAPGGGSEFAADAIEIRDAVRASEARPAEPLPASTAGPALALDLALPAATELPAKRDSGSTPIGALHGVVRDAATSNPITGATIRVDLAGGAPLLVKANGRGQYTLALPEVPDNFALTAAGDGYIPESKNVAAAAVKGRSSQVDFSLKPANETVVAVEEEPEVHHLGNNRFEGTINSQFQRESEGAALAGEFSLSAAQAPPRLVRARITVMVKGVQCPHRVYVNGTLLQARLDQSPDDGSFGELSIPLPAALLREGENTLEIRGVSCHGDLDDFEFVNVQIHLVRPAAGE